MPSYIPAGDVSYIKPQYANTSLNRNMMFPGIPQYQSAGLPRVGLSIHLDTTEAGTPEGRR